MAKFLTFFGLTCWCIVFSSMLHDIISLLRALLAAIEHIR
jgi:hypothetical protein